MDIIAQQMAAQKTIQNFLIKFITHLREYFRKSSAFTQDKFYTVMRSFTQKLHQYFPQDFCLENICSKTIAVIKMRIDDKFIDDQKQQKNIGQGLDKIEHMMKQFSRKSSVQSKEDLNRNINAQWLKKLIVDQLNSIKEDLTQNQQLIEEQICKLLNIYGCGHPIKCLILDSELQNKKILEKCSKKINMTITTINTDIQANNKPNQILLKDISSKLKNYDLCFVSCDSILKNGNVLGCSGALMVALNCKMYKKPLYCLSRGFCLTDKIILENKILSMSGNPLKYFKTQQVNIQKVYIAKKYDIIQPKLVKGILTEFGAIQPQNNNMFFEQFYEKI